MINNIIFDDEMKNSVVRGINKVARAVSSTLGPAGRTVVIESQLTGGTPTITKDGVSVAKSITLKDPVENVGASLVKNIAGKTNLVAGDGTTTSTVLAQAIVEEGLTQIEKGINPINIKSGINKALEDTKVLLKKKARDVQTKEEIAHVATISANDDKEIGNLIAEAIENIGRDGVITVEDSKTTQTTINYVEGMQFDKGYISSYFCNNPEQMIVDYKHPLILIYRGSIVRAQELLPILEYVRAEGKQLLIIANDVSGEALTAIVYNDLQGVISVCAVKAPGYGDNQKDILEDIAIATGAMVIDQEAGMKLESCNADMLGSADFVKVTYNSTTIVNGSGDEILINDRATKLRKEIETCTGYDKEKLQERLAKLTGGVAVLNIGATTEVELKEKKHRVEDALNATRAAIAEGIIPGGGSTLAKISNLLKGKNLNKEESIGYDIVARALKKPFAQIIENAGLNPDLINDLNSKNAVGYDVLNRRWVNMFRVGIVDPVKVTRSALENAVSIASLVLTSSCVITNENDDE